MPRVRSHCRFRNRGTEYVGNSGVKWMGSNIKRPCNRSSPGVAAALVQLVAREVTGVAANVRVAGGWVVFACSRACQAVSTAAARSRVDEIAWAAGVGWPPSPTWRLGILAVVVPRVVADAGLAPDQDPCEQVLVLQRQRPPPVHHYSPERLPRDRMVLGWDPKDARWRPCTLVGIQLQKKGLKLVQRAGRRGVGVLLTCRCATVRLRTLGAWMF